MLLKLQIRCDNAAFEDNMTGEVFRILGTAGKKFSELSKNTEVNECSLCDSNGNRVGFIEVDPECKEDEDDW